jgi:YidC/Oxa1 family membrane protein insertase
MDKNFIVGLVLIMLMLIGYQMLVPKPAEPTPVAQVKNDTPKSSVASTASADTAVVQLTGADSGAVAPAAPKDIVFETEDARIVFTNKGGVMKEVMLKKYKTFDQKPLYLIAENHNKFQIDLPTQTGDVRLTDLSFTTDAVGKTLAANDSAVVTYRATLITRL